MDLLKRHIYERLMESTTTITGDMDVYVSYVFKDTMMDIVKEGKIESFLVNKFHRPNGIYNTITYTTKKGWCVTININHLDIITYLRDYVYMYANKDYKNT